MGYGWNVMRLGDANDTERIGRALEIFRRTDDRPTLIIIDSHIGYGAPHKQDTSAAHGEPLGEDEVRLAKESYGWPADAQFLVPDGVYEHFQAGIGAARAPAARGLGGSVRALPERPSGARRSDRADAAARAAGRLGRGPAERSQRTTRASPAANPRARC